jgi:hypothetical protein
MPPPPDLNAATSLEELVKLGAALAQTSLAAYEALGTESAKAVTAKGVTADLVTTQLTKVWGRMAADSSNLVTFWTKAAELAAKLP